MTIVIYRLFIFLFKTKFIEIRVSTVDANIFSCDSVKIGSLKLHLERFPTAFALRDLPTRLRQLARGRSNDVRFGHTVSRVVGPNPVHSRVDERGIPQLSDTAAAPS